MKEIIKILVLSLFLLGFSAGILAAEEPDKYPSRPVTLTGAFAAGGSTDMT
jgi:tripartite-type tricarboxylate transporter receptor subunit TctC